MAIPVRQYSATSDTELVEAALLGHMPAFDELVRRFRGAVILVAEQVLYSREAAEDVAQEAFLLAFKALPQLQDRSKFSAWLCAIARNRAQRVARRDGRARPVEPSRLDALVIAHSETLSAHPGEEFLREEEWARLRATLAGLPPDYRIALQLHHFEDWPVARIADFLSLPITTVKWRLHYGRRRLYRQLAGYEEG